MTTNEPVSRPNAPSRCRHSGSVNQPAGKNAAAPANTKAPAKNHHNRGKTTTGGYSHINSPAPPNSTPWYPAHGDDARKVPAHSIAQMAAKT